MRFPWLKAVAAVVALGLHVAVLAMVLSAPVTQVALGQPDALEVQFVELGPAVDPAPAPPAAALPDIPEPEPIAEVDPEPAFEPAPEPEPEPVVETPEPEAITEAPPPKPVVKPKPKPKVQPKPQPKPAPRPQPVREAPPAVAASATQAPAGGAPRAAQARGEAQAVDPDRPRTIGRVDYLGRRPNPAYPRLSQRRGEQGRVVLRVLISPQGQVAHVTVQRSSGYARLDEAAVQAMQQARFRPYTENGVAYKALVDIPFDFVL